MFKRGEQVIAEVKSTWCCIDVATMRPARLARDVVSLFMPN
jgi:acyl-CoA thioester hydrolase